MMSLLCLDKQVDKVRDKLVEQTILEVDNVGRGDMACDEDWLVMGSETGVTWTGVGKVGVDQQLDQISTDEEVVQVGQHFVEVTIPGNMDRKGRVGNIKK